MREYDHIFFDLDNTIWDFEENSRLSIQELYNTYLDDNEEGLGFEAFFESYIAINMSYWDLYRNGMVSKENLRVNRFHDALKLTGNDDMQFSIKFSKEYLEICPIKTKLVDGALEVLEYAKEKNYRMSIITNGFEEVQHIKVKNCGLEKYFEEVVTSERAAAKKPHPQIFQHAASLVDAKVASCLMIGDNHESDIIGANNLGMDTAFYSKELMTDGFRGRWQITHLRELKEII